MCGQLDLLIEPLKGCKGVYAHRQNLLQRVMRMPDRRCAITSIALRQAIFQAPKALPVPEVDS